MLNSPNSCEIMDEQTLYQVALPLVKGVGVTLARQLEAAAGSAKALFCESPERLLKLPGMRPKLLEALRESDALKRAEAEIYFCSRHNISILHHSNAHYPVLLNNAPDAPFVLFFKGEERVLTQPSIAVIGTRNATPYGVNLCSLFVKELQSELPNFAVTSGLAYGIDIAAHRAALRNEIPTTAVLAHGLDRIYPPLHRGTAAEMLANGGLLTEYLSGTTPDRPNFVRRNRIVAGMASAIVVVESNSKGGAMLTAEVGELYGKPLFAYPGRIHDEGSKGCNELIASGRAQLLYHLSQIAERLGIKGGIIESHPIQQTLFVELSPEEQRITESLKEGIRSADELSRLLAIPIYRLKSLLIELEMKEVVRPLPGGHYQQTR